jgi:hypothetical protein
VSLEEQKKLARRGPGEARNAFKALAADALKSSNESFLRLAQETLEARLPGVGDLDRARRLSRTRSSRIADQLKSTRRRRT